jgi:hypothetical protein
MMDEYRVYPRAFEVIKAPKTPDGKPPKNWSARMASNIRLRPAQSQPQGMFRVMADEGGTEWSVKEDEYQRIHADDVSLASDPADANTRFSTFVMQGDGTAVVESVE